MGGNTLSTSAFTSSCTSTSITPARPSTPTTLCCGRYSIMPAYCSAQALRKMAPWDVMSGFASSTSTLLRGLARWKYQATWHARS